MTTVIILVYHAAVADALEVFSGELSIMLYKSSVSKISVLPATADERIGDNFDALPSKFDMESKLVC